MKFKLYIRTVALAIIASSAISCESYLDENPQTLYDKDTIYSTKAGVESALDGCYRTLQAGGLYMDDMFDMLNNISGLFTYKGFTYKSENLQTYRLMFYQSSSQAEDIYEATYSGIFCANDILDSIEEYREALEDELGDDLDTFINTVKGEAYIIRALMMFNAVRLFGPSVIHTTPVVSLDDAYVGRSPIEDSYKIILEDLTLAEELCLDKEDQLIDRYHKMTATALKAKVYVQMACILKYPGEPLEADFTDCGVTSEKQAWELALAAGKEVVESQCYELVSDYSALFDWNDNPVWYSPEAIIEIQCTTNGGSGIITLRSIPDNYGPCENLGSNSGWGRTRPQREVFLDHVDNNYNGMLDYTRNDLRLYDNTKDPRIDATFIYYDYTRNYTADASSEAGTTEEVFPHYDAGTNSTDFCVYLNKYIDKDFTGSGSANANYYVYRYSDLLLTMAEAAAELEDFDAAVGYVNEVLDRARGSISTAEYPLAWSVGNYTNKEDLVLDIMYQRRYELLGEGHDWFDARRRGYDFFVENISEPHNNYLYGNASLNITAQSSSLQEKWGGDAYAFPTDKETSVRQVMLLPIPTIELTSNLALTSADQNYGYSAADSAEATDE